MKVAVLMGGMSKEREISLRSGKAVSLALSKKGHQVIEMDARGPEIIAELQSCKPDCVFLALHGRFGEDGSIQGVLTWLGIPYTGPNLLSSAIAFDKIATKQMVMPAGVKSPAYAVFHKGEKFQTWKKKLKIKCPLIVKPNTEGSTIGISRVMKSSELEPAILEALRFDDVVLVEQYIQGRELTVGVLGGKALPIVEIVPKSGFYDFESKYTKGKTEYMVPAQLNKKVAKTIAAVSEKVVALMQINGAVRLDFMLSARGIPYFLEVNTIPGMTETSLLPKAAKAQGMEFEDLCEKILCLSLKNK